MKLSFKKSHIIHTIKSCGVGCFCFASLMTIFHMRSNSAFADFPYFFLYFFTSIFLSIILASVLIFANALFHRPLIGTTVHRLFLSFLVVVIIIGFYYYAVEDADLGKFDARFKGVVLYILTVIGGIWHFPFYLDEPIEVTDNDILDDAFKD